MGVVAAVVGVAAVSQREEDKAGRMIDRMDKAMLALQAAGTARKLYGVEHAAVTRQVDLALETLAGMLAERAGLRLVRLEQSLVFDDVELPSSATLAQALTPRLAAHGIEWLEFRAGLPRAELVTLLEQLERTPATNVLRGGTTHIKLGQVGRRPAASAASIEIADADAIANADAAAVLASLDGSSSGSGNLTGHAAGGGAGVVMTLDDMVRQFRAAWESMRRTAGGGDSGRAAERPDQRLGELVETIRLAVAVGSDVCAQLARVKNHDEYTFVHTVNVAILSAALGEAIGMRPNQVFDLTLAALLHDVGKQHTPLAILNKPGKLDDGERQQMEQHATVGAALLLARRGVPDVAPIVAMEHHANVDGTGYPRLRRNTRPHVASQIVHVADVFDALRTHRPYRAAMDETRVRAILMDGAGKQFDAALLDLFLNRVITPPQARGPQRASA
jgi:putative nucleotidyltransferase with HDIG domain